VSPRYPLVLLVALHGCAMGGVGVIVPAATFGTATASGHSTFCGGMAASDSTVYDTTQVTERPLLYEVQPLRYPKKARARGVEGRVLLAVTINADGRPDAQSIQTISSPDSELTDAAVRWVRSARFEPVCLADRAVRVRVAITVDFKRGL
jgi:TonB family protein